MGVIHNRLTTTIVWFGYHINPHKKQDQTSENPQRHGRNSEKLKDINTDQKQEKHRNKNRPGIF